MKSLNIQYDREEFVINADDSEFWVMLYLVSQNTAKASIAGIDQASRQIKEWWEQHLIMEDCPIRIQFGKSDKPETLPSNLKNIPNLHSIKSKLERFKELEQLLIERGII